MSKHIHCFGKNQQEPKCKDIVQMSIFNGAVHFYSLIIFHLRNSYHPSVSQFSTHRDSTLLKTSYGLLHPVKMEQKESYLPIFHLKIENQKNIKKSFQALDTDNAILLSQREDNS